MLTRRYTDQEMKRHVLLIPIFCMLISGTTRAASRDFPKGWIPFTSIYYVTEPNANGDRLVVGKGGGASDFYRLLQQISLPTSTGETFSDTVIELAPGKFFTGVYVPTAQEKSGDFSNFGPFTDPKTQAPFPGSFIPSSRLYDPYAFRIRGNALEHFPVAVPHIAFGSTWKTTFLLRNESEVPADAVLRYFANDGTALSVPIGGQTSTQTAVTIPAYGQVVVETDDLNQEDISGWAALDFTNSGVKAQGVFLWKSGVLSEAAAPVIAYPTDSAVPASTTLPFDNRGADAVSGYAFANNSTVATEMVLRAFDDDGTMLGTYTEQLKAFGHNSFLLADKLPQTAGKRGVLQIIGGVAPMGFKFINGGLRFTTWMP